MADRAVAEGSEAERSGEVGGEELGGWVGGVGVGFVHEDTGVDVCSGDGVCG